MLKQSLTASILDEAGSALYDAIRGFRDVDKVFDESDLGPYTEMIVTQATEVVQSKIQDCCRSRLQDVHTTVCTELHREMTRLLPFNVESEAAALRRDSCTVP